MECLEKLLIEYPNKEIYVIMDNWSAHKSHVVKVWNTFHERMHLVYLPTKASWMNMIERVFSKLDKDVLQNSNYQTVNEMISRISNYFDNEQSFMNWCS